METPRSTSDRQKHQLQHKSDMLKKGSSSQPVPMRQRRRSYSTPCFGGLLLYSLLCISLLLTLAAEDSDHITLNGDTVEGGIEHNAVIVTVESVPIYTSGGEVPLERFCLEIAPEDVPVALIGTKCSSRINALAWAREQGISAEIIAAIEASVDETNISLPVLLAIGEVESNHNQRCIGDGGRAIGWGQVHRSPWQRWAMKESGRVLSLDILEDNVLISAMVLEYSGYHEDPFTSYARYNGGPAYKCSKARRYARMVTALVKEIGGER